MFLRSFRDALLRVRDDRIFITETTQTPMEADSNMLYYSLQLAIKGTLPILPQRLRDGDAFQRNASKKGRGANRRH